MADMQQVLRISLLLVILACQVVNGSSSQASDASQHHASRREANPQSADFDSLEIELLDSEGDDIDSLEVGDSIVLDFIIDQSLSAKSGAPFIPSPKTSVSDYIHEQLVWWGQTLNIARQFIVIWSRCLFGDGL